MGNTVDASSYGWQATREGSRVHAVAVRVAYCAQNSRLYPKHLLDGEHVAFAVNVKRLVYVLRNEAANRYYTGLTSDVAARLAAHNDGRCPHTADGKPWRLDVVIEFADEPRAVRFEKYLKSGSGAAFANRHLR